MHLSPHTNPLRHTKVESIYSRILSKFKNDPAMNVAFAVLSFTIAILLEKYIDSNIPSAVLIILLTLVILIVINIARIAVTFSSVKKDFFANLAKVMGFTYTYSVELDTVSGRLFEYGNEGTRQINDVLSGTHEGKPARLFTFSYVVGDGKQRRTINHTVFELSYDYHIPHMILTNIKQYGGLGVLTKTFANVTGASVATGWKNERVHLEGDFDKHFLLHIEPDHQIEAREIFTPDVMEFLINHKSKLSMEACDKKIYVYSDGIMYNPQKIAEHIETADMFLDIFAPRFKNVSKSSEEISRKYRN